jgi:hypothetical protein
MTDAALQRAFRSVVGALPVGIETRGMDDVPYQPTQIFWTYKRSLDAWSGSGYG